MKSILYGLALLALLVLPTRPAYARDIAMDGRVVIGQSFTLKSGERMKGDLVVVGGEAVIEETAVVEGDVIVIGGSLTLDGEASGSAVVIGGGVSMGQRGSLAGDVVTLAGSIQRPDGAHIGGNIITNLPPPALSIPNVTGVPIPPVPPQPRRPFDLGPAGKAAALFFQALFLDALAMLLTAFLHPQLERAGQALVAQPFMAGSIGLLTAFLAPMTVIILVVTLILIPVALAAVILLVLAWLFGVIALGILVGDRLTQILHRTSEPVLSAGFGTFVLALAVGTVNLVPCVGWLASALVGLMGLGAAVITMFGTRSIYAPTRVTPPT